MKCLQNNGENVSKDELLETMKNFVTTKKNDFTWPREVTFVERINKICLQHGYYQIFMNLTNI